MMHLGLNYPPPVKPEDWPLIDDLGVTWIKTAWGLDAENDRHGWFSRYLDEAAEHGLQVVVDVRLNESLLEKQFREQRQSTLLTTVRLLYQQLNVTPYPLLSDRLSCEVLHDLRERLADALAETDPGAAHENILAQRESIQAWRGVMAGRCEQLQEVVQRYGHQVKDWEIQGELRHASACVCPIAQFDLALHLGSFHDAIRQVDPQARVWTGGSGVMLGLGWLKMLVQTLEVAEGNFAWHPEGLADRFQVANWHHYGQTVEMGISARYELDDLLEAYDEVFGQARRLLDKKGRGQPFASTEWGIPVCATDDLYPMKARRYHAGEVYAVPEADIGIWYEACLENFSQHDFRVLCIHHLREYANDPTRAENHWGGFCGLWDVNGKERASADIVRRYAWEAKESGKGAFENG